MDFASATVHKSGNQYQVSHGEDRELYVEFLNIPVQQMAASEEEGRPIFKDISHIKIMFPGDRTKQVCRPVKYQDDAYGPADKNRFPRQWAAFEAQKEQTADGTPLAEWPMVTGSQVMEMKAMHVHTVDALASLSDSAIQNLGIGALGLREKAKLWLSKATDGAEMSQMVSKLQKQEETIELLQRQIAELTALYAQEDQPRKGKARAA